jgi:hypothetical protein
MTAGARWYWLALQLVAVAAGAYGGMALFDVVTR